MLKNKQIEEIRAVLESSREPLFLFDNDADGLCSFLILQRALGKGTGIAIKSYPALQKQYAKKVSDSNADAVFVLDKALIDLDFISAVPESIPIVWIDHHENEVEISKEILARVKYYNSFPTSEPTTYLCHEIFKRKSDEWLAMVGCIADAYLPSYSADFASENPELFANIPALDAKFETEIGRIGMIFNFALKDKPSHVRAMIDFLIKTSSAQDVLQESPENQKMHARYRELNEIYNKLIEKADQTTEPIIFTYAGEISMNSELANAIWFRNQDKTIVVAYRSQDRANISVRGKKAKKLTLEAIKNIPNAVGGGHDVACGARVPIDELENFKENFKKAAETV